MFAHRTDAGFQVDVIFTLDHRKLQGAALEQWMLAKSLVANAVMFSQETLSMLSLDVSHWRRSPLVA
jgi:hypothetical protein